MFSKCLGEEKLQTINLVLVEPQIPQNTGNIARTCACVGARLHIVKPMGFTVTDAKLKRAGLDYWDKLDITYYENMEEFLTCVKEFPVYYFTTKGKKKYSDVAYPDNSFLVFGREDKGLPEDLLAAQYKNCVRLPMRNELRSLNLSNTVAIAAYEVLRQWDFEGLSSQGALHHTTLP